MMALAGENIHCAGRFRGMIWLSDAKANHYARWRLCASVLSLTIIHRESGFGTPATLFSSYTNFALSALLEEFFVQALRSVQESPLASRWHYIQLVLRQDR